MFQLLNGVFITGAISCSRGSAFPILSNTSESPEELGSQIGLTARSLSAHARHCQVECFRKAPMESLFRNVAVRRAAQQRESQLASLRDEYTQRLAWTRLVPSRLLRAHGKQALDKIYGMPIFQFFRAAPRGAQIFNQAMSDLSTIDGPAVADAYSFGEIHSIVDVGGGHGLLLATILARNPHLKGTLYEVPHVVAGAKDGRSSQ